jgi:hypothetical protein
MLARNSSVLRLIVFSFCPTPLTAQESNSHKDVVLGGPYDG